MKIKCFVLAILIFLIFALPLVAQEAEADTSLHSKFQRIEWNSDDNALEYRIEIQNIETKKSYEFKTDKNVLEFNLPSGNYRYRVAPYDFLGRELQMSAWQDFSIRKMVKPEVTKVKDKIVIDSSTSKSTLEIPIEASGVESDADVSLVNIDTGDAVPGKIESGKAVFPKVDEGNWKVHVENKSGLETESPVIQITDEKKIRERTKAEEERLAVEKKLAEEKARLEAEEQARLEAEEKRLAKENEERIKAEREAEEERLAMEKKLAEEKARLEAEEKARLEVEEKAHLEAEEKASLEEPKKIADDKKAAKKNRPEKKFAGVYFTLGIGYTIDYTAVQENGFLGGSTFTTLNQNFSDSLQKVFDKNGNQLLFLLGGNNCLSSFDAKLEYNPWKIAGFEAGFTMEVAPSFATFEYTANTDFETYYQMAFYPLSLNAQLLMPILKNRWVGVKAGVGVLVTHSYIVSAAFEDNLDEFFTGVSADDFSSDVYYINYMLQIGAFIRVVSYGGFVFDIGADYVLWNYAVVSTQNIVVNISFGFKI